MLELDPQNEIAIATIGSELQNTDDRVTIFKLISLCDEYEIAIEIAVDSLVKLLGQINSGDSPECMAWVSNTFYYLEKLAQGNHNAINGLIQLLNKIPSHYPREDIEICELVLKTLGRIGTNDSAVIDVLENFLKINQPDSMLYVSRQT